VGTTPDEIRNEIEHTRADLGVDVDRIVDRTSPKRVVRRRAERARAAVRGARERIMGLPDSRWQETDASGGVTGTARDAVRNATGTVRERGEQAARTARQGKEQVMETAEQAVDTARHGARQAADAVEAAPEMARERTRGNPLGAGVVAFGLGLVAASLIPSAPAERAVGRRVREHADEVTEPLKQVAAETGKTARDAAQKVGDAAADAARTTGQQAREQGEDVADQARRSAGNIRDEAG
jgi:ElaB/YqjD/DUF883 family membrane-anchored ribosome-binding protein